MFSTVIVVFFLPGKEISKISSLEATIVNSPSKFVVVPLEVPFTTIVAPANVPNSSDTIPEMVFAFFGIEAVAFIFD